MIRSRHLPRVCRFRAWLFGMVLMSGACAELGRATSLDEGTGGGPGGALQPIDTEQGGSVLDQLEDGASPPGANSGPDGMGLDGDRAGADGGAVDLPGPEPSGPTAMMSAGGEDETVSVPPDESEESDGVDGGVRDPAAEDPLVTPMGGDAPEDAAAVDEVDPVDPDPEQPAGAEGSCSVQGCASSVGSQAGCGGATLVGRSEAGAGCVDSGGSTCGASSSFDGSSGCGSAAPDQAYQVFMQAGERLTVKLNTGFPCNDLSLDDWEATLLLLEPDAHCTAGSCGEPASCKRGIVYQREVSHLATVSGYHTLVVEASSPDHRGSYYLVVELQCDEASCGC